MPILVAPVSALRHQMPPSFPWGMPSHFVPEGYPPVFEFLVAQPIMYVPPPMIPHKFKVPDFEKYKGNSCPLSHLLMYARKMSTQTDNYQTLIHYFQDSLIGVALKWYMGLDSTQIHTSNDLGEDFVSHYKYNVDMAPDRDQLCDMSQKDKENFKEYTQRWHEISTQVNPPLEEKEMTKLFLKTLGPFYYDRMVAGAPNDFTEMVNMGMRLEEGVCEGRLKESGSSETSIRYGNGLPKKKKHDANAILQEKRSRSPRSNQRHQHVA
ncbi:uncharacterized protein LOC127131033 [Lathyrus oleraceus]|uniref:uncharacterized protein LOC127131033 n=1 Tax=Pisum sativum TaxID=3888 RepID=UPI0021D199E5|nr:uncharacterized protein LOC127131033 [Pisum sativum]